VDGYLVLIFFFFLIGGIGYSSLGFPVWLFVVCLFLSREMESQASQQMKSCAGEYSQNHKITE